MHGVGAVWGREEGPWVSQLETWVALMGERDGGGGVGRKEKEKKGSHRIRGRVGWVVLFLFVLPALALMARGGVCVCVFVVWCFMACFVFVHGAIM